MNGLISRELKRFWAVLERYISLNVEYAKLTAAEKFTMLSGAVAIGVISLACISFILVFLGFACAELFKLFMAPALAYLSTAGIFLIVLIVLVLLRNSLIINPIAKVVTRILFARKPKP